MNDIEPFIPLINKELGVLNERFLNQNEVEYLASIEGLPTEVVCKTIFYTLHILNRRGVYNNVNTEELEKKSTDNQCNIIFEAKDKSIIGVLCGG